MNETWNYTSLLLKGFYKSNSIPYITSSFIERMEVFIFNNEIITLLYPIGLWKRNESIFKSWIQF